MSSTRFIPTLSDIDRQHILLQRLVGRRRVRADAIRQLEEATAAFDGERCLVPDQGEPRIVANGRGHAVERERCIGRARCEMRRECVVDGRLCIGLRGSRGQVNGQHGGDLDIDAGRDGLLGLRLREYDRRDDLQDFARVQAQLFAFGPALGRQEDLRVRDPRIGHDERQELRSAHCSSGSRGVERDHQRRFDGRLTAARSGPLTPVPASVRATRT